MLAVGDMGNANNKCTFEVFSCLPSAWASHNVSTIASFITNTSVNAGDGGYGEQAFSGVNITAGHFFGLMMYPNATGRVDNLTLTLLCEEI